MKSFTITFEAQGKFPTFYHVMDEVNGERDMSGNVHANCVRLIWYDTALHERRRGIFDAVTGEYITED